jgi:hypothetical protein
MQGCLSPYQQFVREIIMNSFARAIDVDILTFRSLVLLPSELVNAIFREHICELLFVYDHQSLDDGRFYSKESASGEHTLFMCVMC